ncbi:hypothetical protein [Sinorhizobium meliloti]|uniref:hypothetical protein n=1 Tax=Rhizobium meliloti TaxID=382 RepID=UPI002091CA31|nr:hypothetical protein [Sinorhizobium meliloti]MCO5965921.1 hypothetical protein [Sinorhizobium meliloti]
MLAGLERDDRDLRVVFKQTPVFGPDSVFAARAALASRKQGKFSRFARGSDGTPRPGHPDFNFGNRRPAQARPRAAQEGYGRPRGG